VIVKETIDNALDACETAGVAPEITAHFQGHKLEIRDNGGGIRSEIVKQLVDYVAPPTSSRTSLLRAALRATPGRPCSPHPCVVVKLKSLILGEYAEYEFRKQFTASERGAVGKAIEAELGNRKGRRTDLGPIGPKSDMGRSADIAAKRSGFTDRKTFERAKTVNERGSPCR
jgi:hypothetical protein